MKLLIITATRGASPFWSEAISSVARAAPAADHVVVCSEAHRPQTRKEIRFITEQGQGLYSALNQGLRESVGRDWDAFTWLNDDDRLLSSGFGELLKPMSTLPEIGIGYGRVEIIDTRGVRLGDLPVARRGNDLLALLARGIVPLAQPGTIIRRSVWEKVGGFDESYRLAGDLEFFVRALEAGAKFQFFDAAVASFRLSAGQLSKRSSEMENETRRVLQRIHEKARWAALWRFRFENFAVYLERLKKHGWVSMSDLQQRTH